MVSRFQSLFKLPVGELWVQYQKLHWKKSILTMDILFNQECLHMHVIPKYISVKIQPSKYKHLIPSIAHNIMKLEIKHKYHDKHEVLQQLMVIQRLLMDKIHPIEFDMKDDKIRTINATKQFEKAY
ncbi:uncharacterized protein LOC113472352 [Diaphorina citri]|uniref:Uncharacterized protein LOC113472352 n=1 Tax=Diaphorina citri TaxID=121845 RepID=A0A3Q0JL66_DIACI|nr:uncharacterized protein LOC113472352 [Diaphorina citri]